MTADLVCDVAMAEPDREAYVHGAKRATYGWLDRAADGFAATLLDHGVAPGDVVVLLLPSSIKFAVCYVGAMRIGAITSAVNLRLGPSEQASILSRTEPKVTVVGDGASVPVGVDPGYVMPVTALKDAFAADPPVRLPKLRATDPTCIVWTSGTTGAPKGAVYDHERQAAISHNIGELTVDGDRRLSVLPFPHVGYMTRVWDEVVHRTTVVLAGEPWSAAESLRLIREEGITMATGVPTQWQLVLEHPDLAITDFSGLRVAGLGAAAIPPELVRRMRETLGCPVLTRYTSTEAGVTTSTRIGDPDEVVANTVGRPAPDVEVRIATPDGQELGVDEVGEVLSRSPAMMNGYWRDPELTATVVDADGWLHTGDLGFLDPDGNLRIVGRLKEMYIRGGYNVYPSEVEAVLAEHPAVSRAAVVGLPDSMLGEVGVAFLVPADGIDATTDLSLDSVREWCRSHIADYKAPDRVVLIDELPMTSMLKIDKAALSALAEKEALRERK